MFSPLAAIWRQLGNLNGQQKGILEERFKTVDRDLSKKGLVAGYKRAAFEASAAAAASTAPCSLRSSHDGPLFTGSAGAGGIAAAGTAGAGGYYQMPGQLSSTAGLISLSAAADAAAAAGSRRVADGINFSLQTGDYAASSQHPSMLLTGPPARGLAAGSSSAAAIMAGTHPLSLQIPEATAVSTGISAPSSASAGAPHYQPLQSFTGQAEICAEWDKCLAVLQHGEHRRSLLTAQTTWRECLQGQMIAASSVRSGWVQTEVSNTLFCRVCERVCEGCVTA